MAGAKAALSYCSENFSPYQFRQMRILEFPAYQQFAQSFPNTVPYSEGNRVHSEGRPGERRARCPVLHHGARGRAPVVGAPGSRRRRRRERASLRVAGRVQRASDAQKSRWRARAGPLPETRHGSLPPWPGKRARGGEPARDDAAPAVHPLPQRARSRSAPSPTASAKTNSTPTIAKLRQGQGVPGAAVHDLAGAARSPESRDARERPGLSERSLRENHTLRPENHRRQEREGRRASGA